MADASDSATVRWGFIGCGRISHDFATAMAVLPNVKLQACAARSLSSAEKFAAEVGVAKAYDSYEALCSDPEVDVVYIGTLHTSHAEHATLALNHGKHVLVEKPMAMNAKEASQVISLAKEKGLFFMEGMWTRFFPAIRHVRKLLAEGAIGEVQQVQAAIGFNFDKSNDRVWKRALGGGGLLDLGIYPVAFATMVFGFEPAKISAVGRTSADEGVDLFASVTLEFDDHKFATLQYSMLTRLAETVTIHGSTGRILIDSPAHLPTQITVTTYNEDFSESVSKEQFPWPTPASGASFVYGAGAQGFQYEAEAVTCAVLDQRLGIDEYSPDESLGVMKIMDAVRQQLGVVYDADN